jgi:hypothetical protein
MEIGDKQLKLYSNAKRMDRTVYKGKRLVR